MKTPIARLKAIGLMVALPSGTNAANTANMMTAAATTTLDAEPKPVSMACRGSPWCT
ncbi:Uncharacterised protein [Mycobacteroides abscessus subsp. abscessus]|nr:Uncharacterised protein [Mycobacteroides abscessus subsp. abscessus]